MLAYKWFKRVFADGEGSVFLLSNEGSILHRRRISRRKFFHIAVVLLLLSSVTASLGIGAFYYWSLNQKYEMAKVKLAEFVRDRSEIESRLERLNAVVSRTNRFLIINQRNFENNKGRLSQDWSFELGGEMGIPSLDQLLSESERIEGGVHKLYASSNDLSYYVSSQPKIWPSAGYVSSEFGTWRSWGGKSGWHRHEGIDIAAPIGTAIRSVADGVVKFIGYKGGYGKTVEVEHGYGMSTIYAHCSRFNAKEGIRVKGGELIAYVGNTGSSTGPHLHFEIQIDGVPVDPRRYLPE